MPCAEAGLMEGATAEEGPLMQKQLLCIGCVLGQGLCSVICIPDFMPTHPDCPGTFTIFTHPQNPPTSTSSSKPGQTLTLQLILSTTRRDSRPLITPFYRWRNQSSERLRILIRAKQLLSAGSWTWTQAYLIPKIQRARNLTKCQSAEEGRPSGPSMQCMATAPSFL